MTASFVRSHCLNLKLLSFPLSTSLPRTPGPSPRKALLLRHLSILQGFMGPSPSTPKRHPGAICVDPKKASWGHLLWPQIGLLGPSASASKWHPGAICFGPRRASWGHLVRLQKGLLGPSALVPKRPPGAICPLSQHSHCSAGLATTVPSLLPTVCSWSFFLIALFS